MISNEQLRDIMGSNVETLDGDKIGSAGSIYTDDQTGQPEWVTVRTGMFGTKESFVPLAEAEFAGGTLRVPYSKDQIKNAPQVDPDGHLSPEQESDLYRYYGLSDSMGTSDSGMSGTTSGGMSGTTSGGMSGTSGTYSDESSTGTSGTGGISGTSGMSGTSGTMSDDDTSRGTVGHDTSGPTTDDAMTRSEERLHVGTEKVEAGRARLRKFIVTENVQQTVPVTREEVRLESEPITDGNVGQAMDGPALSEEEHEVVLHEERPVVAKEAVPVERVRLSKDAVTEEHQVNEEVRQERIEPDTDIDLTQGTEADSRRGL